MAFMPIKTMVKSLIVAVVSTLPPMLLPFLLLEPGASGGSRLALYFGIIAVWLPIMVLAGAFRWSSLGIWRPGWRPCLCDQPVRCRRHHSSPQEHNRPGVVATLLVEREDV
jgi:membrane protease YdiL (CAAX protease family)